MHLFVDLALESVGESSAQLSQPVVPALWSPEQRPQPCDPQLMTCETKRARASVVQASEFLIMCYVAIEMNTHPKFM